MVSVILIQTDSDSNKTQCQIKLWHDEKPAIDTNLHVLVDYTANFIQWVDHYNNFMLIET